MIKKLISSICLICFTLQYGFISTALASDISGVTPKGNVYNINPQQISGTTGFRQYYNFKLSEGDIANLIYKSNYNKFVNLVNSQVLINGILNTINENGAFSKGHAIFVSPNGIVIGASGVLNVGALTLIAPTTQKYNSFIEGYEDAISGSGSLVNYEYSKENDNWKGLINNLGNNVTINGKIISRGDVDIYGNNITVAGTENNKAGIISGLQNNTTVYDNTEESLAKAKALFDTLVKNNISDANSLNLQNGKLNLIASNVKSSTALSSDIENVTSSVTLNNANIGASEVAIKSTAQNEVETTIADNYSYITHILQTALEDAAPKSISGYIEDYFKDGATVPLNVKAAAKVDVKNSNILSGAKADITSYAKSNLKMKSSYADEDGKKGGDTGLLYYFGTTADAQTLIEDSVVNAVGAINLYANAINNADIEIKNNTILTNDTLGHFSMSFLSNDTTTSSKVNLKNTIIDSSALKASATSLDTTKLDLTNIAAEGENASTGIVASGIIKKQTNTTEAVINGGKIKTKSDSVEVYSNSVNVANDTIVNKIESVTDNTQKSETLTLLDKVKALAKGITDKSDKVDDTKAKEVATSTKAQNNEKLEANSKSAAKGSASWANLGGIVLVNNSTNTNNAKIIGGADITSAKNVNVKAQTVDLTKNSVTSNTNQTSSFSANAGVIVNNQTNNTTANIDSSNVKSTDDINVFASTELPDTTDSDLKISMHIDGLSNDVEIDMQNKKDKFDIISWDTSKDTAKSIWTSTTQKSSTPVITSINKSIESELNNYIDISGTSSGVAGSVVVNTVKNNTDASITNSTIEDAKNVYLNAANLVREFNSATGGSVIVNTFDNNAKSYINSTTTTNKVTNDIKLDSATDQKYITIAEMGNNAIGYGVTGAVTVQNFGGETSSIISGSDLLKSNNIYLNAGKASIYKYTNSFAESTTDLTDTLLNATFLGAISRQKNDENIALGAVVNYNSIDRTIKALIADSTINVSNESKIIADTDETSYLVSIAGSFKGGTKAGKGTSYTDEESAPLADSDKTQDIGDYGNWKEKTQDSVNKADKATNDEAASTTDSTKEVKDTLKDEDVKTANLDTDSKADGQDAKSTVSKLNDKETLTDTNTKSANSTTALSNLKLALIGAANVNRANTKTEAGITNSTVTVEKILNVDANNDQNIYSIAGGIVYGDDNKLGSGAAVNITDNYGYTKAYITGNEINKTVISFTNDKVNNLNVNATNTNKNLDIAVGFAGGSNDKVAIGGSFNMNMASNEVSSLIDNAKIGNSKNVNMIDINVISTNTSNIQNAAGGLDASRSDSSKIGAGLAGNVNTLSKTTKSEVKNSSISNGKDININSNVDKNGKQIDSDDIVQFAMGGSVVLGTGSAYTFEGGLGTDIIKNTVSSVLDGTTINKAENINILAGNKLHLVDVNGALEFSTSSRGFGVGIGCDVEVIGNNVLSDIKNSTVKNSSSITSHAMNDEILREIAANLGLSGNATINVNGMVNILNSSTNADIIGSTLTTNGNLTNTSDYKINSHEITVAAAANLSNFATGANIVTNITNTTTKANIDNATTVKKAGVFKNSATSSETYNIIPASVGATLGAAGVAADIVVNVNKGKTESLFKGNIDSATNAIISAVNESLMYTRGGVAALSTGTAAVSGLVYIDVMNKTVTALSGDNDSANTLNADNVQITASAINSYGAHTKDAPVSKDDLNFLKNTLNSSSLENTFSDWDMAYNLSGASVAGIEGTVLVKVINNNVTSSLNKTNVTGKNLDVIAKNETQLNQILGAIAGSGTASVGIDAGVNVLKSNVLANITNNSVVNIATNTNVGASNIENLQTVSALGAASGVAAVGGAVDVNVLKSKAEAKVENSTVNNTSLALSASNGTNVKSVDVAATASGTASVGAIVTLNKLSNIAEAYLDNVLTSEGKTLSNIYIDTASTADINSVAVDVAGSGVAAVGGYSLTNIVKNTANSYIKDSTLSVTGETSVTANKSLMNNFDNTNATFSEKALFVGVGLSGAASVNANAIVNVVNETVKAYVDNSSVNGGKVTILAGKKSNFDNNAIVVSASGAAAVPVSVTVNVLTDNIMAYINNTALTNVQDINVKAKSSQNIDTQIIPIGASLAAAVGVATMVNNYESKVNAYIDMKDKNITSTGKVTVNAESITNLNNNNIMVNAAIYAAVGAIVNVNIINDTVQAQVLGNNGLLTATSLDIGSNSVIGLDVNELNIGAGAITASALVNINNIGGKLNVNDVENGDNMHLANAVSNVTGNFNKSASNYSTTTANEMKAAYSPVTGDENEGTVSNINAKVKTTGNTNVKASNTLKGYDSDTSKQQNTKISAGVGAIGASVFVTKMKYKTNAKISGGNVESKNVNLTSDSVIKSDTKALGVTVSGANIDAGVAYFRNQALTKSSLSDAIVRATGNLNITSDSKNTINADSTIVSVSGAAGVAVKVANIKEENNTISTITGSNVDVKAKNMNITSSFNDSINTSLKQVTVSGLGVDVTVSKAEDNALSQALIDATGNIDITDSLNIYAYNNGIDVKNGFSSIAVSLVDVNVDNTSAIANATTNAGINDSNDGLTLTAGDINVLSGLKSDNKTAGTVKAVAETPSKVNVSGLTVSVMNQKANASGTTKAIVAGKSIKANNLTIKSMSDKSASAGGDAKNVDVSGLSFGKMSVNAIADGSNEITLGNANSNIEIQNAIKAELSDKANASTKLSSVRVSIVSGYGSNLNSIVNNSTNISTLGIINANSLDLKQNVLRKALSDANATNVGALVIDVLGLKSDVSGTSKISYGLTSNNDSLLNATTIDSDATNESEVYTSNIKAALVAISKSASDGVNAVMDASNILEFKNANVNNKGDFNANINNTNILTMDQNSVGGGFVSINITKAKREASARASMIFDNSKITAKNINLTAQSTTKSGSETKVKNAFGGFVDVDRLTLNTDIKQNTTIDIKNNSKLYATNNFTSQIKPVTEFKQYVDGSSGGFAAENKAYSYLNVTNNNTLNIIDSYVMANNDLNILMDIKSDLSSVTNVDARGFGSGAYATAETNLTVNSNVNLKNSRLQTIVDDVNIKFYNDTNNNLVAGSYATAKAAVPVTHAYGGITTSLKGNLDVDTNSVVQSGRDINIFRNDGTANYNTNQNEDSYYLGFIHKKWRHNNRTNNNNMDINLNGKLITGGGNSAYVKIDKDGNVISETMQEGSNYSFAESDYDPKKDPEYLNLKDDIADIDKELDLYNNMHWEENINNNKAKQNTYKSEYQALKNKLYDIQNIMTQQQMSDDIVGRIVNASGDSAETRISTEKATALLENISNNINHTDAASITATITTAVNNDNNISANYKQAVITTLSELYLKDISNETVADGKYSIPTYIKNGQLYYVIDNKDDIINDIQANIDSINSIIEQLDNSKQTIINHLAELQESKNNKQSRIEQIENCDKRKLADGSIMFYNINFKSSKVTISGLNNLTGTGEIQTSTPGLKIDNYSSRSMIFNDVLYNYTSGGLIINGVDYSQPGRIAYTPSPSHNVQKTNGISDITNAIEINTYYDHNNPLLVKSNISNIVFNGIYNTNGLLPTSIFNDSGDIIFNNLADGNFKQLVATQGNVLVTKSDKMQMNNGSKLFAGKDINIKTSQFINNADVKAGNSIRNITIDDTLYNKLTLNEDGVINMDKNGKSVYLMSDNNIKAVRDNDGNIHIYITDASKGSITIDSDNITGNGTYTYSSGNGKVDIVNNTNHKIIVHNLSNDYTVKTSNKNATKISNITGDTTITSNNAETELAGSITNAIGTEALENKGTLSINAKGITLDDSSAKYDINATGEININSTNGSTIIGSINNNIGNISINETTGNVSIKNAITASTGNITVIQEGNTAESFILSSLGRLNVSKAGNITVESKAKNTTLAGAISTEEGNILVTSNGNEKLSVADISSGKGNITILNENADAKVDITENITNKDGNINILSSSGADIQKSLYTKKGDLTILTLGSDKLTVNDITNDNGEIIIATISDDTTLKGAIKASLGNIEIYSMGESLTLDGGSITLNDSNTQVPVGKDYNIKITNSGYSSRESKGGSITLKGDITAYKRGNILIENDKDSTSNLSIAGAIKTDTGYISITNNSTSTNPVINTIINGTADNKNLIQSENGNVIITNSASGGTDIRYTDINANNGNVIITSNDGPYYDDETVNVYAKQGIYRYISGASGDINYINSRNDSDSGTTVEYGDNGAVILGPNYELYNGTGDVKLTNVGNGMFIIMGDIHNNTTQTGTSSITLDNQGGGSFIITGNINNYSVSADEDSNTGNLEILNNGGGNLFIGENAVINNKNGDVIITNASKQTLDNSSYGAIINGTITNENGSVIITNNNEATVYNEDYGTSVNGAISTKNGNIAILNYDGDLKIEKDAVLVLNEGNANAVNDIIIASIKDDGLDTVGGISIDGYILNAGKGDLDIYNYGKGNTLISSSIEASNGDINIISYNSEYGINTGADSIITATNGNLNIENAANAGTNGINILGTLNATNDISINDTGSSININKMVSNTANVSTAGVNLEISNANVNKSGSFKNYIHRVVLDNNLTHLIDSTVQLYTQKTGEFSLGMNNTSVINTSAPVVNFNPDRVVNKFNTEGSFYNLTYKENKIELENKNTQPDLQVINPVNISQTALNFSAENLGTIISDIPIKNMSVNGAIIENQNYTVGQKIKINLNINNSPKTIQAEVTRVYGNNADIKFINVDKATENQILYELMSNNSSDSIIDL